MLAAPKKRRLIKNGGDGDPRLDLLAHPARLELVQGLRQLVGRLIVEHQGQVALVGGEGGRPERWAEREIEWNARNPIDSQDAGALRNTRKYNSIQYNTTQITRCNRQSPTATATTTTKRQQVQRKLRLCSTLQLKSVPLPVSARFGQLTKNS